MALKALSPDYEQHIEYRDLKKNFHGNRVVYVHWEEHLSFRSAIAFPLPPDMPFAAFIEAIVKLTTPPIPSSRRSNGTGSSG